MYNATEHFTDINKAGYANAVRLAALSLENAEKLVKLNLNTAKAALAQGVEGAQAAATIKDVQELFALRAKFTEAGVQAATGYSRTLYELSSEAQSQFSAPRKRGRLIRRASHRGWKAPRRLLRPVRTSPSTR